MKICTSTYKKTHTPARPAVALPGKIAPGDTFSRIQDNSIICQDAALSADFPSIPLGDEKELALLFLDIRNFTAFMESRSAYDVIYVIRQLFVLFGKSIKEAGGRIIETAGDSIYAVFGLDSPIADAVQSSVNASSAIFHDLEIFNTTYAQPYFNLNFEIGIGLHKGKVIVGRFDMDYNAHTTVMGLPVNIAARLQSATKEVNNNLLMSEDAYQLLNQPAGEHEGRSIDLKGITAPVKVRLMGQPYGPKIVNKPILPDDFDYYMAIAG